MIIRYNTGQRDYFFDEFPLLYMKIGILAEIFLYQFAILNKWYDQEKNLITKDYENKLEISRIKNQISRELHDDVGTTLSKINLQTYLAIQKQKDPTFNLSQVLHSIQNSSEEILSRLKDIVWFGDETRTNFDLVVAVSEYAYSMCESKGVRLIEKVDQNNPKEISVSHKYQLLLICKEAINNALKYSNCNNLTIEIRNINNEHLNISVSDDGNGFETKMSKTGAGLKNMTFRAEKINAQLQINSVLNQGTTIQLTY
jgi:signal transduction histidine kinase